MRKSSANGAATVIDSIEDAVVVRKDFDAVLARLIATPPTPKAAITRKIKRARASAWGKRSAPK